MPTEPEQQQLTAQHAIDPSVFSSDACHFVHEGLEYTVRQMHGAASDGGGEQNRHVSGQQLCDGLRALALARWGRMARTVLRKWSITSTLDFGRIVYTQIEMGQLQKVEDDSIEDFHNVYDFQAAFETGYRIPGQS